MDMNLAVEKMNALLTINVNSFAGFTFVYSDEFIGKDKFGKPTTLFHELGEVAKLTHQAYIKDGINYYNSKLSFSNAELTEEERIKNSNKRYKEAAKKLLFLNSCCKRTCNKSFIIRKIDINNEEAVKSLVDSFEFIVSHFEMLIKDEI